MKLLLSKEKIAEQIKLTAAQIHRDYSGQDLVIVMVLKGALCVVADLIREIDLSFDVETVQCSSYGLRGTERGELEVLGVNLLHIHNRDVLVVDDIYDSGHTMKALFESLKLKQPRSLKSCVLLYKNNVPKINHYRPDYVLFDIDNLFVVGYGLDYKEKYRGLPGVYVMDPQ